MLRSADVQTSGKSLPRRSSRCAARRRSSSSVSVPASKNFSISCSSASATISISASRAAVDRARPCRRESAPSVNLPLPSVCERERLHRAPDRRRRVKRLLFADRQLNRDRPCGCRRSRSDSSERSRLARSRSSRLSDDQARQRQLVGRRPDLFGLHHRRRDTASTTTSAASATRSAARASLRKLPMPGRVDEVDLVLVPLGVGEAGRQRVLAGDFFFVEVGDGRAVVDLAEAVDHAGVERGCAEASCVLPEPLWPTSATLRMLAAS